MHAMLVIRVGKYRYSLQCSHYDSISSTAKEQTPESIISYLYLSKGTPTSRIILDDTQPQFDHTQFVEADWTSFYPDAAESILPNAPELKVKSILVLCFVDGDHSGNQVNIGYTGIIIFCQRAPTLCYTKYQNAVETSTFGSEFIATCIVVELIESICYELRMFNILINGPANVFCDNNGVDFNLTCPKSTLKKKHNAITYHHVQEAVATGTIHYAYNQGR